MKIKSLNIIGKFKMYTNKHFIISFECKTHITYICIYTCVHTHTYTQSFTTSSRVLENRNSEKAETQ